MKKSYSIKILFEVKANTLEQALNILSAIKDRKKFKALRMEYVGAVKK